MNENRPWCNHYTSARARCKHKGHEKYPRYGGRGIEFLMTQEDFKTLWYRDKAWFLEKPSIDRIDIDGHYELGNCRFIELSENSKLGSDYNWRGVKIDKCSIKGCNDNHKAKGLCTKHYYHAWWKINKSPASKRNEIWCDDCVKEYYAL